MTLPEVVSRLKQAGYVASSELAMMLHLQINLDRPLLLEGPAGSGKTQVAYALAQALGYPLVRLSCYEGMGSEQALYEWNYAKQLAAMQGRRDENVFTEEFMLDRPLLKVLRQPSAVLLIDEVDRADEAFEALLLEFLQDFQVSIPELGTVRAPRAPVTILTSNRTRPLSDALRRRCLYSVVPWPSLERELAIVRMHLPESDEAVRDAVVRGVQCLRQWGLVKSPGIGETLDWLDSQRVLGYPGWTLEFLQQTLGCVLKEWADIEVVESRLEDLLAFRE